MLSVQEGNEVYTKKKMLYYSYLKLLKYRMCTLFQLSIYAVSKV